MTNGQEWLVTSGWAFIDKPRERRSDSASMAPEHSTGFTIQRREQQLEYFNRVVQKHPRAIRHDPSACSLSLLQKSPFDSRSWCPFTAKPDATRGCLQILPSVCFQALLAFFLFSLSLSSSHLFLSPIQSISLRDFPIFSSFPVIYRRLRTP